MLSNNNLHNFYGKLCTINKKKYLATKVEGISILVSCFQSVISTSLYASLVGFTTNIAWIKGVPHPLNNIEDGIELHFDAIAFKDIGYQAIIVWSGPKPAKVAGLCPNEFLMTNELKEVNVHCLTVDEDDQINIYVFIDDNVRKIPIRYECASINGFMSKSQKEMCCILSQNNNTVSNKTVDLYKAVSYGIDSKYVYICHNITLKKSDQCLQMHTRSKCFLKKDDPFYLMDNKITKLNASKTMQLDVLLNYTLVNDRKLQFTCYLEGKSFSFESKDTSIIPNKTINHGKVVAHLLIEKSISSHVIMHWQVIVFDMYINDTNDILQKSQLGLETLEILSDNSEFFYHYKFDSNQESNSILSCTGTTQTLTEFNPNAKSYFKINHINSVIQQCKVGITSCLGKIDHSNGSTGSMSKQNLKLNTQIKEKDILNESKPLHTGTGTTNGDYKTDLLESNCSKKSSKEINDLKPTCANFEETLSSLLNSDQFSEYFQDNSVKKYSSLGKFSSWKKDHLSKMLTESFRRKFDTENMFIIHKSPAIIVSIKSSKNVYVLTNYKNHCLLIHCSLAHQCFAHFKNDSFIIGLNDIPTAMKEPSANLYLDAVFDVKNLEFVPICIYDSYPKEKGFCYNHQVFYFDIKSTFKSFKSTNYETTFSFVINGITVILKLNDKITHFYLSKNHIPIGSKMRIHLRNDFKTKKLTTFVLSTAQDSIILLNCIKFFKLFGDNFPNLYIGYGLRDGFSKLNFLKDRFPIQKCLYKSDAHLFVSLKLLNMSINTNVFMLLNHPVTLTYMNNDKLCIEMILPTTLDHLCVVIPISQDPVVSMKTLTSRKLSSFSKASHFYIDGLFNSNMDLDIALLKDDSNCNDALYNTSDEIEFYYVDGFIETIVSKDDNNGLSFAIGVCFAHSNILVSNGSYKFDDVTIFQPNGLPIQKSSSTELVGKDVACHLKYLKLCGEWKIMLIYLKQQYIPIASDSSSTPTTLSANEKPAQSKNESSSLSSSVDEITTVVPCGFSLSPNSSSEKSIMTEISNSKDAKPLSSNTTKPSTSIATKPSASNSLKPASSNASNLSSTEQPTVSSTSYIGYTGNITYKGNDFYLMQNRNQFILLPKDNIFPNSKGKDAQIIHGPLSYILEELTNKIKLESITIASIVIAAWKGKKRDFVKEIDALCNVTIDEIQLLKSVKNDKALIASIKGECKEQVVNKSSVLNFRNLDFTQFYECHGSIYKLFGDEGLMLASSYQANCTVYCIFHKCVAYYNQHYLGHCSTKDFHDMLNTADSTGKHLGAYALVYQCEPEFINKNQVDMAVALLWLGKKPKVTNYNIPRKPLKLTTSNRGFLTLSKAILDKTLVINTISKNEGSAKGSLDHIASTNLDKTLTLENTSLSSNSTTNLLKLDDQFLEINNAKSKSGINSSISLVPKPTAQKCSKSLIRKFHGKITSVSEAEAIVETENKQDLTLPRNRCFLYGINLDSIKLTHLVKIGYGIDFSMDEFETLITEAWIGEGPRMTDHLTYRSILTWCTLYDTPKSTTAQLLHSTGYIPPECDPIYNSAKELEEIEV